MPSTTAPILILSYVLDTLTADTTLLTLIGASSIVVPPVPNATPFPRVVIENPSSEGNLNALQAGYSRIQSRPRVQISIISANENADLINQVAARIETILDGVGSEAVTNGEVVSIQMEWDWYQSPVEANAYHATIYQQYSTAVKTA